MKYYVNKASTYVIRTYEKYIGEAKSMTSLQSRSGVLRSSTVQIWAVVSTTSTYSYDYKGLDGSFFQIPPSFKQSSIFFLR